MAASSECRTVEDVSQGRVIFYGFAVVYLFGVVAQFFLAGLGVFGTTSYDAHKGLGFILGLIAIVLLVLALASKLPRPLSGLALLLVLLNIGQIVFIQIDIGEIKALHLVNALAIALVANMLVQRSRRYLAAKLATP
ncbi:MAG: DUF6220 domain-containing protein [Gaiellaceae bacterium]